MTPRPSWTGLVWLAAVGLVWLLGELSTVNALSQFALTAFLVLAVVAVLGTAIARKLSFPLAFLFFAVPVGEFVMPQLMEWTADFTVLALRLSGIPVYREGLQFVIPSGKWSVVEACSGLRYLIASLMVGTLFAYLSYRSLARRLIFVAFAAVVPIVANWLRAYMIVMLGHLSSNKLAVGVDHYIYGWVFFGIVIAIMFWVGGRWREDDLAKPVEVPRWNGEWPAAAPVRTLWAAAAAVMLVAVIWKIGYWGIERSEAASPPHIALPAATGDWLPASDAQVKWQPHFSNPPAELQGGFRKGSEHVGLYIAYYRNQTDGRELVSSENALVKSTDPYWARVSAATRDISIDGESVAIRTAELHGSRGERVEVWQWYWINGRFTSSDHVAKAYTAWARLQGRGDDSAVIVLYADKDQPGGAGAALESFTRTAAPAFVAALQQARDSR